MKRKTKFAHTSRGGVCKKDKDTKMKNGLSKQNTITRMVLSEIKPLPYNPPSRTDEHNVLDLAIVIEERIKQGLDPLPASERLLVGKDGVLGDGHRRRAALLLCGVESFWVEIDSERNGVDIFTSRASARKATSQNMTEAYIAGLPEENLPPAARRNLVTLRRLAGDEAIEFLKKYPGSSSFGIHKEVRRVMKFCGMRDQSFGFSVMRWLVLQRTQRDVRNWIQYKRITVKRLLYCIEKNIDPVGL
jgi:hypothetical protein